MKKTRFISGVLALVVIASSMSCVHAGVISIDLTGKTGDNAGSTGYLNLGPVTPGQTANLLALANFSLGMNQFTGLSVQGASAGGIAVTGYTAFNEPVKFNAGDTIGSANIFDSGVSPSSFRSPFRIVGDFGPDSFIGFQDGLGRYGYIEVTYNSVSNTFKLISAAYESSPGVAIQTPSGVVPEPTSMAIFGLGALGVAYCARRKSKA